MLASLRCNLTLNDLGTGLPRLMEDLRLGEKAANSIHNDFNSEDVLESAISTVSKNLARNRSLWSNASFISGIMSLLLDSNAVVLSKNRSIEV